MNYELAFWIVTAVSSGFAVAQIFRFLPSRSKEAIDRILYFEKSQVKAQADLKRIADALEFFVHQFPEHRTPYFERLLGTFQEWVRR